MQNVHPTTLGDAYWADPEDIAYRFSYKDGESFFLGRSLTNFDQIVGTNKKGADDKHVGLFGKTRGSKGRSFIIPNLLSYEGSVVSVDPKGENASVCAARRANGDDFCDGVGQDTYVLDPNRRARNVPEELYASCNLLDYIDPNDPDLFGKCAMLVRGLTLEPKGGESADWSDEGVSWTTLVMAHLLTTSDYRKSEKNLWLVQKLIIVGYMDAIDEMEKAARAQLAEYKRQFELWEQEGESADSMPERPEFGPKPNGIELMLKRMQDNRALDGQIALQAKGYAELRKDNSRQWAGIHRHSIRELEFLNNLNIKDSVFGSRGTLTRALDVRTLKSTPNGVSIFICLKGKAGDPAIRWQRALLTLICDAMQEEQGVPENGKPLLMCIDEFNDLKRMDDVVEILNQGAGAGIKFFLSILNISGLKQNYGEGWEQILAALETKIWIGLNDNDTPKWLEDHVGEAHVEIFTEATNKVEGGSTVITDSTANTEGTSGGESTTEGNTQGWNNSVAIMKGSGTTDSFSEGKTKQKSSTWSFGEGTSLTRNLGISDNNSHAVNHPANTLFRSFFPAVTDTRGKGKTKSTGHTKSANKQTGGTEGTSGTLTKGRSASKNESETKSDGESFSESFSKTLTSGWHKSTTKTNSRAESTQWSKGETQTQTVHRRPLITRPLFNMLTKSFDERDHPYYPGFAIVTHGNEAPFMVRRCPYDEDPYFAGKFTPHYAHEFIPWEKQRLVGGQYTDAHFIPIRLPVQALENRFTIDTKVHVPVDEWFQEGDPLFTWQIKSQINPNQPFEFAMKAPCEGKVIGIADDETYNEEGAIMFIRLEEAYDDARREELAKDTFLLIGNAFEERKQLALEQQRKEQEARNAEAARKRQIEEDRIERYVQASASSYANWMRISIGIFPLVVFFFIVFSGPFSLPEYAFQYPNHEVVSKIAEPSQYTYEENGPYGYSYLVGDESCDVTRYRGQAETNTSADLSTATIKYDCYDLPGWHYPHNAFLPFVYLPWLFTGLLVCLIGLAVWAGAKSLGVGDQNRPDIGDGEIIGKAINDFGVGLRSTARSVLNETAPGAAFAFVGGCLLIYQLWIFGNVLWG